MDIESISHRESCPSCKVERGHVGNKKQKEWDISLSATYKTIDGLDFMVRVATKDDIELLLAADEVFYSDEFKKPALNAYTKFEGWSYPYICIAIIKENIVGKLFLDRNAQNAVRQNLSPAIIDNIVVAEKFRRQHISNHLIDFAESIVNKNGGRWIEIGVSSVNFSPLSSYVRKGYSNYPLIHEHEIIIFYEAEGLDFSTHFEAPRYDAGSIIVYKDIGDSDKIKIVDRKNFVQMLIKTSQERYPSQKTEFDQ
ncbi:MAG: GNAT family N-acetyltransferase [Cyanobacteria bacterium TGS_CYA1]|nr:GNAT family N-acetyltransferase [Cyanobacteria bacterium TGS_CYA1]